MERNTGFSFGGDPSTDGGMHSTTLKSYEWILMKIRVHIDSVLWRKYLNFGENLYVCIGGNMLSTFLKM